VPRVREEGAGGGFGQVAGAGRLDQASGSSLRRRNGAGWGEHSRCRPLGLIRPDCDRQARRSYAATVKEMSAAGPHSGDASNRSQSMLSK